MAGSSILRYLVNKVPGVKVRASWHNLEPVFRDSQVEYIKGDLRSLDYCRKMSAGCDCLIMSAAFAGGAGFIRQFPWKHMKENLLMNMQILEAAQLEKVRRVIFVASATVYQDFEGSIKEDEIDFNKDPHEAYFGYAWGVRFIERMCKFLHRHYDTQIVIARTANIFGPYDKFNPQSSNFIPAIIRKAVERMDPFEVWGSSDVTRDVIYADDFARGVVMMAAEDSLDFEIFNLGSGVRTTVGDVVKWALEAAGHKPSEIRYLKDRPTTIQFRALDCKKAKSYLGWEPEYSIKDAVAKTCRWWVENRDKWKK